MSKNLKNELRVLLEKDLRKLKESNASSVQAKSDLLDSVAELMSSIEEFKEDASPAAVSHVGQLLNDLVSKLVEISERPDSFTAVAKQLPKKVTLKPDTKVV